MTCKFKNGRKKDSPMIAKDYRVLAVYDKFYNKWYMSSNKKKWSPIMDGQLESRYHFAVRLVEHRILEFFEDVRLSDDTYDICHDIRMITEKDIIRIKRAFHSSMMDDDLREIMG